MTVSADWSQDVLTFWFEELEKKDWFNSSEQLDETIRARFGETLESLREWPVTRLNASPEVALAAIIVLDQFSRNIHRGEAGAFAQDALAVKLAEAAVDAGFDEALPPSRRHFMYMPFMHAEDRAHQARSLKLFASLGDENTLKFARDHADTIARFGRYPYRNAVLGRTSTPEEKEYLKDAKTYGQ